MRFFRVVPILIFTCSIGVNAQVNSYDKPADANFRNTYVSPDWGQLNKAFEYSQSIHDRNAKIIDEMIDNLYSLKRQTNSSGFKKTIDDYLTRLKNLRLGSLIEAEPEIKIIDWAIRDEIDKYISGSNTSSSHAFVRSNAIFSYGSYVETIPNRSIVEKPESNSKEIANTNSVKYVVIKGMPNDNFYTIDFDLSNGYISKDYLLQNSSWEAYNEFYSRKNPQERAEKSQPMNQQLQELDSKTEIDVTSWKSRSFKSYNETYKCAFVTDKTQDDQFIIRHNRDGSIELILYTEKNFLENTRISFQFDDSKDKISGNIIKISEGTYKCTPSSLGSDEMFVKVNDLSKVTIETFISYLKKYNRIHINVYSTNQYAAKSFDYYFTLAGATVNLNWVLTSDF